jgi:hypothetical protein
VYVGSKSTLAEGTNFASTKGTENEVTEVCGTEVRTLMNRNIEYIRNRI